MPPESPNVLKELQACINTKATIEEKVLALFEYYEPSYDTIVNEKGVSSQNYDKECINIIEWTAHVLLIFLPELNNLLEEGRMATIEKCCEELLKARLRVIRGDEDNLIDMFNSHFNEIRHAVRKELALRELKPYIATNQYVIGETHCESLKKLLQEIKGIGEGKVEGKAERKRILRADHELLFTLHVDAAISELKSEMSNFDKIFSLYNLIITLNGLYLNSLKGLLLSIHFVVDSCWLIMLKKHDLDCSKWRLRSHLVTAQS